MKMRTRPARGLAALFAVVAPLLWSVTAAAQPQQNALQPGGPLSGEIEHLWWFIFWITLVVFVLVMAVLTSGAWRRKVDGALPPELHPDPASEQRHTRYVLVAALLTVLTLFAVLVYSVRAGRDVYGHSLESKNPITIQVIGHQWWWEVQYPNSDASMWVTTANEIHVPTGKPIVLLTSSRDVIHSFWAPNLQGKRDLIPGYQTAIWFQADKEGTFRGQCAEFCGAQHAHMAFFVIAEPMDKFQQWLAGQTKSAPEPSNDVTRHGRDVFLSGDCIMCHTIRGTNAGSRVGPDLTHVGSRTTIAAGTLPNTAGSLGGWIADSQSIKPGNRMPPNALKSEDLQALVAYLQTLK
jgi:cytochrome c oxidase subunit II